MDWEGAQELKEAVAGSVLRSPPESKGRSLLALPTTLSSLSPSSVAVVESVSPTFKTSQSPLPVALVSSSPTTANSTCGGSKEVAGRLLVNDQGAGYHLHLHHIHTNNRNSSSLISSRSSSPKQKNHHGSRVSSPISLVVVKEEDKEQKQPTDLSNPNKNRTSHHTNPHIQQNHSAKPNQQVFGLSRKNKPIPPPLDLSIGANANLSLHHNHQQHNHQQHQQNNNHPQEGTFNPPQHHNNTNNHQIHNNNQYQSNQQSPYLGSPKFTQSDKSLPLRKRWHSWSPVPMNGQEDSMVPLYPDSQNMANMKKTGLAGVGDTAVSAHSHQQQNQYHQAYSSPGPGGSTGYGGTRNWILEMIPTSSPGGPNNGSRLGLGNGMHAHNPSNNHNSNTNGPQSSGSNEIIISNSLVHIQTPSPFYTPNEPSPKFMNSPVFSYSNPDTSLYQGPFSPMRASSLYPPPNSPFTNLSLNSPLGPLNGPHTPGMVSSAGGMGNSCFNMIPSTLLSPAPSQASTNSLSYEDLHEKSLSFFSPVWSIFTAGTKVRFVTGMNSMDWYLVDFLAQSSESLLGLKGDYAPHGLEVRKFIVTSSAKERIQVTFCPIGDPHHPAIEINCEPGHPFMVDKKGWCAVKPEVFQEIYGTQCQTLECGDICLSITAARSPSQYVQPQQQQHQQHHHHQHHHHQISSQQVSYAPPTSVSNSHNGTNGMSLSTNNSSASSCPAKMEPIDVKVPISIVQQHQNHNMPMPMSTTSPVILAARKTFASPISAPPSPAKRPKENSPRSLIPGETKGRRPMNAFLLFAKDKRPELIQMYPGKDNRSISVLLGEAWQTLAPSEKEKYASNARARAEEQKRIHPDCWKRKRSQSTSS